MKWIMASLLSILIVVPVFTQNANIFNDIDSLLLQGDLAGAKIKLDDIGSRHLASDLGSDGPHRYLEYGRVYDVLFFAAAFRNEYKRFQESSMATEDMTSLNAASSKLNSAWASLTALTHLSISNPLRDQLNTIPKEANSESRRCKEKHRGGASQKNSGSKGGGRTSGTGGAGSSRATTGSSCSAATDRGRATESRARGARVTARKDRRGCQKSRVCRPQ